MSDSQPDPVPASATNPDPDPASAADPAATRRSRLWRRLRKIALWTAGVLVVLVLVLQFALGSIIKSSASTVAPMILGTDVAISNVHARVLSGRVYVSGLVVGPPEGFDANLCELGDFRIDLDMFSLLRPSRPIHVREIVISDPMVTYELKGVHDNLHALLRKLGADDDGKVNSEDDQSSGGRKVVIDHFLFEGGKARVAVLNGKGVVVPLPKIELEEIGSKNGGATALEATAQILASITKGTVVAVADVVADIGGLAVDAVKGVGGAAAGAVKSVGNAIGGLFGGDDEKKDDGAAGVGTAAMDAVSDIGGAAVDATADVGGAAVDTVKDAGNAAVDVTADVGGSAVGTVKDVGNAAVDATADVGGAAVDAVKGVGNAAVDAAAGVGGAAVDAVKGVGNAAVDAAAGVGGAAMDAVKSIGGAIGGIFGGGDKDAAPEGEAPAGDAAP